MAGLFFFSCPSCRGHFWCCVRVFVCCCMVVLRFVFSRILPCRTSTLSSTLQAWRELGAHILTRTMYLVASPPPPLPLLFSSPPSRLVKYSSPTEAEAAVTQLNNTMLHERRLTVRLDRK